MSTIEEQRVTIPEGTFNVDPIHSSVAFEVGYLGISSFGANVKTFEASLSDGKLAGSALITSLEVKDENLLAHLMAPDFFDAERYPSVSFTTDSVSVGEGEVAFEGELTIKGNSRPARLQGTIAGPITDPYGNTRYGLRLETSIDRTAFGITWNGDMPDGTRALADLVTLKADLSLVKAS
jgi:polyisoprenoid-binding protein YceI